MKKVLLSLFLLLNVFQYPVCFSQKSKIDSLLSLLKKDKEDTNKVIHLNLLYRQYFNIGSCDTATVLANQALALCDVMLNEVKNLRAAASAKLRMTVQKGKATAYNTLANVNFQQGNYPKALDYYLKALKINE